MNLFFWVSCESILQFLILFNACTSALRIPFEGQKLQFARVLALAASCAATLQLTPWKYGFWDSLLAILVLHTGFKSVPSIKELLTFDPRTLDTEFVSKYRPRFYFCHTTHARFAPRKHSFRYPILYVGFPTTFEGSIGPIFSVRGTNTDASSQDMGIKTAKSIFSFFTVNPKHYVNPELPFSKKLEPLLAKNGIDPSQFAHTYLVTTPKFLGYSFNPVSYWYLYNSSMELKLVVLEVNNTFKEKHIYFLRSDNSANPEPRKGYTFAGEMQKMFHISPFNHRSGSYRIQVRDPLLQSEQAKVDMHMVVFARDGSKTMMARAFSTSPALDLLQCSTWDTLRICLTWGLNTYLALPITLFEAWRIFRKNVIVYTKPEPLLGSGQRKPTQSEMEMQDMWVDYFTDRVANYPTPLKVTLTLPECNPGKEAKALILESAALTDTTHCRGCSSSIDYQWTNMRYASSSPQCLTITVNTPKFFARFFSHQNPHHTVYLDIIAQSEERETATVSDVDLFVDILTKSYTLDISVSHTDTPVKQPVYGVKWRLVTWLRRIKTGFELRTGPSPPPTKRAATPPRLFEASAVNTLDAYFFATKNCCSNARPSSSQNLLCKYRLKTIRAILTDLLAKGDGNRLDKRISILQFLLWLAVVIDLVFMGMDAQIYGSITFGRNFWLALGFRLIYGNPGRLLNSICEALCSVIR